jgi:hypothetical protein
LRPKFGSHFARTAAKMMTATVDFTYFGEEFVAEINGERVHEGDGFERHENPLTGATSGRPSDLSATRRLTR